MTLYQICMNYFSRRVDWFSYFQLKSWRASEKPTPSYNWTKCLTHRQFLHVDVFQRHLGRVYRSDDRTSSGDRAGLLRSEDTLLRGLYAFSRLNFTADSISRVILNLTIEWQDWMQVHDLHWKRMKPISYSTFQVRIRISHNSVQKLVSYLGRIFEKVSINELRTFTTDFRIRPDLCVVSIFSRGIHCRLSYVVRRSLRERKVTNTQGYSSRGKTRPTQYSCGILQLLSYICLLYYFMS